MFEYLGFIFRPLRRFTKTETWDYVAGKVSSSGVFLTESTGWDYNEFYKASGNTDCDVFACEGHPGLWVPGRNYLNRYEG